MNASKSGESRIVIQLKGKSLDEVKAIVGAPCANMCPAEASPALSATTHAQIRQLFADAAAQDPDYEPADFESFFYLDGYDPDKCRTLIDTLMGLQEVDCSYEQRVCPAPEVHAHNRTPSLAYQGKAPMGIDAEYAWQTGISGQGVQVAVVERGWYPEHSQLAPHAIGAPVSGRNSREYDHRRHGTAVLGVVCGARNGRTAHGLAFGMEAGSVRVAAYDHQPSDISVQGAGRPALRVVPDTQEAERSNLATAIIAAAAAVEPGDVVLIEAQVLVTREDETYAVPVEVYELEREAIRLAVAAGRIVIECGGNGNIYDDDGHIPRFDQDGVTLQKVVKGMRLCAPLIRQDSGAIVVSACVSMMEGDISRPRWIQRRMDYAPYGPEVDCFAGGFGIHAPDFEQSSGKEIIWSSFGGTSAAGAIIAGAALLVQSALKRYIVESGRQDFKPLSSQQMRALFRDRDLGTPVFGAEPDNTALQGVMPDLHKILNRIERIAQMTLSPASRRQVRHHVPAQ